VANLKKYIIWVILIPAFGLVVWSQIRITKDNSNLKKELTKAIRGNNEQKYILQKRSINKTISDSIAKLKKGKYLVLRLMPNDCHDCIDAIFNNTNSLASKIGADNIIILVGNYNIDDYYKFTRLNRFTLTNFYYFPGEVTDIDKKGLSYYFMINKKIEMSAVSIFITEPTLNPQQTNSYLNWIKYSF